MRFASAAGTGKRATDYHTCNLSHPDPMSYTSPMAIALHKVTAFSTFAPCDLF